MESPSPARPTLGFESAAEKMGSSAHPGSRGAEALIAAVVVRLLASAVPLASAVARGDSEQVVVVVAVLGTAVASAVVWMPSFRRQAMSGAIAPGVALADVAVVVALNTAFALTLADRQNNVASDALWFLFVGSAAIWTVALGLRYALSMVIALACLDPVLQWVAGEKMEPIDAAFVLGRAAWVSLGILAVVALRALTLQEVDQWRASARENAERESPLSPRERQVLVRVADGLLDKEVAVDLGISIRTVQTHLDRIAQKIGHRRRPELVRYAIENGLLATGESPRGL